MKRILTVLAASLIASPAFAWKPNCKHYTAVILKGPGDGSFHLRAAPSADSKIIQTIHPSPSGYPLPWCHKTELDKNGDAWMQIELHVANADGANERILVGWVHRRLVQNERELENGD